jgi:hypothetical protein
MVGDALGIILGVGELVNLEICLLWATEESDRRRERGEALQARRWVLELRANGLVVALSLRALLLLSE